MPTLKLVTTTEAKSVATLAQALRDSANAERGERAPWRQFRAGMAMCIGG
ncbi:MAG: hypothetical protein WD044_00645 [Dongiaceae bacterium]